MGSARGLLGYSVRVRIKDVRGPGLCLGGVRTTAERTEGDRETARGIARVQAGDDELLMRQEGGWRREGRRETTRGGVFVHPAPWPCQSRRVGTGHVG